MLKARPNVINHIDKPENTGARAPRPTTRIVVRDRWRNLSVMD